MNTSALCAVLKLQYPKEKASISLTYCLQLQNRRTSAEKNGRVFLGSAFTSEEVVYCWPNHGMSAFDNLYRRVQEIIRKTKPQCALN